jgi:hypothetical protein
MDAIRAIPPFMAVLVAMTLAVVVPRDGSDSALHAACGLKLEARMVALELECAVEKLAAQIDAAVAEVDAATTDAQRTIANAKLAKLARVRHEAQLAAARARRVTGSAIYVEQGPFTTRPTRPASTVCP